MTRFPLHIILSSLITLIFLGACSDSDPMIRMKEPVLPAQLANYAEPELLNSFFLDQSRYQVTDAGATLGRVLFYDKILSRTNTVSCGSCHLQEHAFSDDAAFSIGINGQVLARNTPGITNLYDDPFLFWDGRAANLEDLALKPVRNHREMGLDDMGFLVAKISKAPYYASLFEDAFGSTEVTQEKVADALAQFVSSMISAQSKYDRVMAGLDQFSTQEQLGQQVFFGEGRCYNCHLGQDFNQRGGGFIDIDPGFGGGIISGWDSRANIGLDREYSDQGMGEFSPERRGEFKIPTLRNIALTAPYMHDGRFRTLDEVVQHYNQGIQDHPNLAPELRDWSTGGPARLELEDHEVSALVSFLETLTDDAYLREQKFSNPFE